MPGIGIGVSPDLIPVVAQPILVPEDPLELMWYESPSEAPVRSTPFSYTTSEPVTPNVDATDVANGLEDSNARDIILEATPPAPLTFPETDYFDSLVADRLIRRNGAVFNGGDTLYAETSATPRRVAVRGYIDDDTATGTSNDTNRARATLASSRSGNPRIFAEFKIDADSVIYFSVFVNNDWVLDSSVVDDLDNYGVSECLYEIVVEMDEDGVLTSTITAFNTSTQAQLFQYSHVEDLGSDPAYGNWCGWQIAGDTDACRCASIKVWG